MPLPTKMLLETSRLTRTYGWIGILALIGSILGLRSYTRTEGRASLVGFVSTEGASSW